MYSCQPSDKANRLQMQLYVCTLTPSTTPIAIYYYYWSWKLMRILPFHRWWRLTAVRLYITACAHPSQWMTWWNMPDWDGIQSWNLSHCSHACRDQATVTLPCTQLLDIVLARNIATERCKHQLLLVKAAAELAKLETRRHVLVKVFLGSVRIIDNGDILPLRDNLQMLCKTK